MMGTVLELISATPPYVENRMCELRFSMSCLEKCTVHDRMVMRCSQFVSVFVPETGGHTLHPLSDRSLHWFWYVDSWLEVELAAPECLHHHLPHGAAAAVPQLPRPRPHSLRCLHYHNCCCGPLYCYCYSFVSQLPCRHCVKLSSGRQSWQPRRDPRPSWRQHNTSFLCI